MMIVVVGVELDRGTRSGKRADGREKEGRTYIISRCVHPVQARARLVVACAQLQDQHLILFIELGVSFSGVSKRGISGKGN
jgi:hypothetical protein